MLSNLPVTATDIVFILISLILIIRCTIRGFIAEFISISSIAGGVIAGFLFSSILTSYILKNLKIEWWNKLVSFLLIFLVAYIIIKLFGRFFNMLIEKINLEKLDHSLGLFTGIFESILLIFLVITIIDAQPFFPGEKILSDSVIASFARKIITAMPWNKNTLFIIPNELI